MIPVRVLAVFALAALANCAAQDDTEVPVVVARASVAEHVGEAQDPSLAGEIGGAVCSAAAAAGCTAIATFCATADVITLGTLTLPCLPATVAACVGAGACMLLIASTDGSNLH
jgi:hypothetical protein